MIPASSLRSMASGALVRFSRLLPSPLAYRLEFKLDAALRRPDLRFEAAVPFGTGNIRGTFEDHNDRRFALHWTNSLVGLAVASLVVRPGDCVFELGANIGTETLAFSALAGSAGRVVAVEPSDRCASTVAARLQANAVANVHLVKAAVTAAPGFVQFSEAPADNSGVGHVAGWSAAGGASGIPAITLDSLLAHGAPSYVFMDIEGAECQALLGATEVMERVRPVMFAEVNEAALQRMGNSVAEFCAIAQRHRYELYDANARGQPAFVPREGEFTDVILLPRERRELMPAIRKRVRLFKLCPWLLARAPAPYAGNGARR